MQDFLRIFLPLYFLFYFAVAFIAKTVIVARRINKNPLVLPKDDSAYGIIGRYFKLTIFFIFIYVFLFAFDPGCCGRFTPIIILENTAIKYAGLAILIFAFIWTVLAQVHMKNSWRIGIDTETKTELVTSGVFRFSRNPVFLGMLLSLLGLFLNEPNLLTLFFFIISYMLIEIQVRLEEDFLTKEHGAAYTNYRKTTGRYL